jgi:hypothetical protein
MSGYISGCGAGTTLSLLLAVAAAESGFEFPHVGLAFLGNPIQFLRPDNFGE